MSHESGTNTIWVGRESDITADIGTSMVHLLWTLAHAKDPSDGVKADWAIIEGWLACKGRPLNEKDNARVAKAWRAYIARGVSPAIKFQPTFDALASQYRDRASGFVGERAPVAVTEVFDRMLASDAEILAKKAIHREAARVFLAQHGMPRIDPTVLNPALIEWWRTRTKAVRAFFFWSAVWPLLVLLYVVIFDPFNERSIWSMDYEDYLKTLFAMGIPLLAGGIKVAYDKLVSLT